MEDDPIDPERMLALAYAPAAVRAGLAVLWRLDMRLGRIVATTTEPAIGAIRMAWWRDALIRLDDAPPPAEPLLRDVAAALIAHVDGAALAALAEGWGMHVTDPDALDGYGRARGGALFAIAARMLGGRAEDAGMAAAGAGWALVDLARGTADPALAAEARAAAGRAFAGWDGRSAAGMRMLGMLAMLARDDLARERFPRPGSPARMARMLRYRLIGR